MIEILTWSPPVTEIHPVWLLADQSECDQIIHLYWDLCQVSKQLTSRFSRQIQVKPSLSWKSPLPPQSEAPHQLRALSGSSDTDTVSSKIFWSSSLETFPLMILPALPQPTQPTSLEYHDGKSRSDYSSSSQKVEDTWKLQNVHGTLEMSAFTCLSIN